MRDGLVALLSPMDLWTHGPVTRPTPRGESTLSSPVHRTPCFNPSIPDSARPSRAAWVPESSCKPSRTAIGVCGRRLALA